MKKLCILFLFCTSSFFATEKLPSTIKNVIVYIDGAQITRTITLELPKGASQFTFDALSPFIQESSIQISGLNNASVISINYAINYLSKQQNSKEIENLQNQIKALLDTIRFEENLMAGYKEELAVIQTNRRLGNENQVVSLEKLQQFTSYYRKRITTINTERYQSEKKKKTYLLQIEDIKKQLIEFNVNDKKQTGEITLKLTADTKQKLNLIIKYNVTNAGWFPVYDLKADHVNTPLQLAYRAHVYQTTGSNWNDIKLTLSTSDPNTNNIKPTINPKYLNFINTYSTYKSNRATKNYSYKYNPFIQTISGIVTDESGPLPGVSVIIKGTSRGTETDFDGNYTLKTNGGKELQFSFVGMKSEIVPIHSSIMNVSLEAELNMLEEVVVTGYGTGGFNGLAGMTSGVSIRGYSSKKKKVEQVQVQQGFTNTRFEIKKTYSIPTDGNITVIEINTYSVPASYVYFTAPVINENVFLTAKIGNWEQYNLLPGEANIYFEGSYSGKTNINPQATTDSLTISMGVDPNIIVKRTQLNNFKKNSFIGTNRIINKAYEIEIKNAKNSAVDLIVLDRIPISQNKAIKVEDIATGIATYNRKKGLLEWKVTLGSGKSKKYSFSYMLKYPKYKRVNI